jgi:hypothetical protein
LRAVAGWVVQVWVVVCVVVWVVSVVIVPQNIRKGCGGVITAL